MHLQQTKKLHGAKAVYSYVQAEKTSILNTVDSGIATAKNEISEEIDNDVAALKSDTTTKLEAKMDNDRIKVLTGETTGIESGQTKEANIPYPSGFTQANTVILGKMISSANNYYDTSSTVETQNGFVNITMIALTEEYITVWFKNIDADEALIGHYKITLLRVD